MQELLFVLQRVQGEIRGKGGLQKGYERMSDIRLELRPEAKRLMNGFERGTVDMRS
jgi:hypothetical protein